MEFYEISAEELFEQERVMQEIAEELQEEWFETMADMSDADWSAMEQDARWR